MKDHSVLRPTGEGRIGIYFLKEIWDYYTNLKHAIPSAPAVEWKYINAVFNALGIGIEPTITYLCSTTSGFDDFESWIEQRGCISNEMISYFNTVIVKDNLDKFIPETLIFDETDIEKWNTEGYVVLKNAIPKKDCQLAVDYICNEIDVDLHNADSWYTPHHIQQGIMIQLFNSAILDKNRLSRKVRLAFEQLWNKNDLLVSMDRVSFNPPETDFYKFPGPNLHWDVSLKQPIPFGLQGLLYLTDTQENQGAFTLVPGFHRKIDTWLAQLNPETKVRELNLSDHFEGKPIAGDAGDLIIWNHCLPHGSRPNNSTSPRIVQYINYQPIDLEYQNEWI